MTNDFILEVRGEYAPGLLGDMITMLRGIHKLSVVDITDVHLAPHMTRLWVKDDDGSGPDPNNYAA